VQKIYGQCDDFLMTQIFSFFLSVMSQSSADVLYLKKILPVFLIIFKIKTSQSILKTSPKFLYSIIFKFSKMIFL
jgi:hypothetical protein